MKNRNYFFFILGFIILQGCKSYTSNIILKAEPTDINWKSAYEKAIVENPIKVGDKIQYTIFTNQGESIIDPSGNLMTAKSYGESNSTLADRPIFEVLESGTCFQLSGSYFSAPNVRTFTVSAKASGGSKPYCSLPPSNLRPPVVANWDALTSSIVAIMSPRNGGRIPLFD